MGNMFFFSILKDLILIKDNICDHVNKFQTPSITFRKIYKIWLEIVKTYCIHSFKSVLLVLPCCILILFYYERDFMLSLSDDNQAGAIVAVISTTDS